MRLTKKQWVFLITVILLLGLLIFALININLFYNKVDIFKGAEASCNDLSEGDKCSFFIDEKEIEGVCELGKKDVLICKPPKPSPKMHEFLKE